MKKLAWLFAGLAWLDFFATAYLNYPGAKSIYTVFSVIFLLLLLQALKRPVTYGTFFLAVVAWIGFWLKLVMHSTSGYSWWTEPTGMFDGSPHAWDEVLLVSSTGAAGIIAALAVVGQGKSLSFQTWSQPVQSAPAWYTPSVRHALWLFAALMIVATVTTNELFDIIKLGHRPALNLPWPWQGVYSWWCNIGLALSLAVVLGLDHAKHHPLWVGVIGLLVAGALISASLHSRGIYVFIALPLAATLWQLRAHTLWLTGRRFTLIVLLMLVGMVSSIGLAQFQRYAGTEAVPVVKTEAVPVAKTEAVPVAKTEAVPVAKTEAVPVAKKAFVADFPHLFQRLSIDRWLGLEGVMAVSAYPGKGWALFGQAAAERRTKDKADLYTGKISQSGFTDADTARYQFATMPGAIGFLYLSSSYVMVFVGMFVLTLTLIMSEVFVYRLTGNSYLCALIGMYITLLIVQLGAGGVVQPLSGYATTMVAMVAAGFVLDFKRMGGDPHASAPA